MQVWTVGEGLGIASEFSPTVCAVNNFRDHEVGSKEQATKLAALHCSFILSFWIELKPCWYTALTAYCQARP